MVEDVAQFSVRGGIFDIYSFGMAEPVRLEFWGDDVAELRHFDLLTPAIDARRRGRADPARRWPAVGDGEGEPSECRSLRFSAGHAPHHSARTPHQAGAAPHLGRGAAPHRARAAAGRRRAEPRRAVRCSPRCSRQRALARAFGARHDRSASTESSAGLRPRYRVSDSARPRRFSATSSGCKQVVADGIPTMILCDNAGQASGSTSCSTRIASSPASARDRSAGRRLPDSAVRPTNPRLARPHRSRDLPPRATHPPRASLCDRHALESLTALKPGDYVVHLEHGVGIYRGIEKIFVAREHGRGRGDRVRGRRPAQRPALSNRPDRALSIRRRHHAPTRRLRACTRSAASDGRSSATRTRAAIQEMTVELLDLYARRKVATRPPHIPDTPWQRQLESSFLFEDTPDQRTATDDVKRDMERRAADGPAARRRRRIRQDGDRGARRIQGGAVGAAGGGARADDDSRRAARAHIRRATGGFSRRRAHDEPLPDARRSRQRCSRSLQAGRSTSSSARTGC